MFCLLRFERDWRKWRAKTSFSGTSVFMGLFAEAIVCVLREKEELELRTFIKKIVRTAQY